MATLPTLVTKLSEADGRPRAAIDNVARILRKNALMTTGKRGVGGPDMTAKDAANLLMALNGAEASIDGPLAVERFRSLRREGPANTIWHNENLRDAAAFEKFRERMLSPDVPDVVRKVMLATDFGSALEALIEGVPEVMELMLRTVVQDFQPKSTEECMKLLDGLMLANARGCDVIFERERFVYTAKIEMYLFRDGRRFIHSGAIFCSDQKRINAGFYGADKRRITITIGLDVLLAAWTALQPKEAQH